VFVIKQNGGAGLNKFILFVLIPCFIIYADKVYDKNKKANKLYEQGKYEDALEIYHDALLESPENKKLSMNKGSAHYRLEEYDKAQESYERSLSVEDQKTRAELLYNMGNVLNKQGDRLASSGSPEAMEKYKAARDSYINSLDIDPDDRDAKWNLQLTQMKIKEMEKQQQQNKDNKDNKDKRDQKDQDKQQKEKQDNNKDKHDQEKDQQQEQKKQEKDREKKQQQQDRQKQEEEQKKAGEKPQPKPEKSKEDMKKEEAMRLLMQYADDADELNKPKKKAAVIKGKKTEKDW
jgi:hypothetical protein